MQMKTVNPLEERPEWKQSNSVFNRFLKIHLILWCRRYFDIRSMNAHQVIAQESESSCTSQMPTVPKVITYLFIILSSLFCYI